MTPIPLTDPGRITPPQAKCAAPGGKDVADGPDAHSAFRSVLGGLAEAGALAQAGSSAAIEAPAVRDPAAQPPRAQEEDAPDSADMSGEAAIPDALLPEPPPMPLFVGLRPLKVPPPDVPRIGSTLVTEIISDGRATVGVPADLAAPPAFWQGPDSRPETPGPARHVAVATLPLKGSAETPPASGLPAAVNPTAEVPVGMSGIDPGGDAPSPVKGSAPGQPVVVGVIVQAGASAIKMPAMIAAPFALSPANAAQPDHAGAMTSAVVLTGRQPGPEPDPAPQAPGSGETRGSARIDGQTPVPQRGSEAAPPTDRGSTGPLAAAPAQAVPPTPHPASSGGSEHVGAPIVAPTGGLSAGDSAETPSASRDGASDTASPGQAVQVVSATKTGPRGSDVLDPGPGRPDEVAPASDQGVGPEPLAAHRLTDRPQQVPQSALPPGFGPRLAEALAPFADRPVELTLSPEELGRVRMTLTTQDGTLTLTIQADRPETIDLMRRHIDQLAQDFRDLGFTNLNFSFGQDGTAAGNRQAQERADQMPENLPENRVAHTTRAPDRRAPPGAGGGLDLRL